MTVDDYIKARGRVLDVVENNIKFATTYEQINEQVVVLSKEMSFCIQLQSTYYSYKNDCEMLRNRNSKLFNIAAEKGVKFLDSLDSLDLA